MENVSEVAKKTENTEQTEDDADTTENEVIKTTTVLKIRKGVKHPPSTTRR